ncbi:SGNH/GDSL hydrolase family protein [Ectopseudomonas composti]
MAFNTGNPIGSKDPRDLADNAVNFDDALNTTSPSWRDRFGLMRKSWAGLESEFYAWLADQGFESSILTYVDGSPLAVQRPTQLIQRAGSPGLLFSVRLPASFPVTLSGSWAAAQPLLTVRADNALRSELASSVGASMIGRGAGTVDAELSALEQADEVLSGRIDNLPPVNQSQPLMSRSSRALSIGQGVVILGDSISAGAYFGNAYTNGWPYLLAKAINYQFGAQHVGVLPMDSLYNVVASYNTDQLHAVTWVGNWGTRTASPAPYDFPVGNVGLAAGDAVNGKTVVSSSPGAYVEIVVPSINGLANIYFVGRPDGGKFDVTVNGTAQAQLDTFLATKTYNRTRTITLPDNGQGEVTIRLTKADSSPTELQSVVRYIKAAGDQFAHFQTMNVCNYSVSGRQLARMSEQAIITATNCACLILALGYNDRFAESDETYYAEYLQRVEWLIHYANINQCLVVVADFAWYSPKTARVRAQLKRIAAQTNGIYIPFPDKFYPDGTIVTDTSPASSAFVSDLRLFADNAHPNFKGNELIFSQIASALGLSITSRRDALNNDLPFPLKLQGTLRNKAGAVSTIKRVDGGVLYNLGITEAGGGTIAAGTLALAATPARFGSVALRKSVNINSVAGTAIGSYTSTEENGVVNATISTAAEISTSYQVATK